MADCSIRVTTHALNRALGRLEAVKGYNRDQAAAFLIAEAGLALHEGRRARRFPRWCVREWNGDSIRYRLPQEGVMRFVWDESRSMVLLLRKVRDHNRRSVWLIITVMAPQEEP